MTIVLILYAWCVLQAQQHLVWGNPLFQVIFWGIGQGRTMVSKPTWATSPLALSKSAALLLLKLGAPLLLLLGLKPSCGSVPISDQTIFFGKWQAVAKLRLHCADYCAQTMTAQRVWGPSVVGLVGPIRHEFHTITWAILYIIILYYCGLFWCRKKNIQLLLKIRSWGSLHGGLLQWQGRSPPSFQPETQFYQHWWRLLLFMVLFDKSYWQYNSKVYHHIPHCKRTLPLFLSP